MSLLDQMKKTQLTVTLTLGDIDALVSAGSMVMPMRILPSQRQALQRALQKLDDAVNL